MIWHYIAYKSCFAIKPKQTNKQWTLTKYLEKKMLPGNYIRMLCTVLKKTATVQPLNSYLTNQVRQANHVGDCLRSKDKFISNDNLQAPTHDHTSISQPTYIYQLSVGMDGK